MAPREQRGINCWQPLLGRAVNCGGLTPIYEQIIHAVKEHLVEKIIHIDQTYGINKVSTLVLRLF